MRTSADPDVLKEITVLKLEYNSILSNQVINILLKIKQKQFELRACTTAEKNSS